MPARGVIRPDAPLTGGFRTECDHFAGSKITLREDALPYRNSSSSCWLGTARPQPSRGISHLRADVMRGAIPIHRRFAEIGFVRHVTSDGGVISKHRVLSDSAASLHRLEEVPHVRAEIVPVVRLEDRRLAQGLLAGWNDMFGAPL